jgi:hypothetical protein
LFTDTNLAVAVQAPYKGGTPVSTLNEKQYTGTITWQTESGEPFEGADVTFEPATVYRASINLAAKTGCTFSGLPIDSFTHAGAQNVTWDVANGQIIILFKATAGADEASVVNLYNLNFTVPVYGGTPVPGIDTEQYSGTITWTYAAGGAIETTFDCDKEIKAAIALTAKDGFTLTGVPANAFIHAGAAAVTNTADGAAVNLTFAAVPWLPIHTSNVAWTGKTINICCYYAGNPGTYLINNTTNSQYWDYGWSSAANNLSNWASIMKDPLMAESPGDLFTSAECTPGHPTVLLAETVPQNLRKRAHFFTVDLKSVTDNIVRIGMYSRSDNGQRWPARIEVFYSNSDIGPFPGEDAASLGIFDVPFPGNHQWGYVDLYPNTAGKRGFSAQYIHVRIYRTAATIDETANDGSNIDASFNEFRVVTNAP